MTLGKSKKIIVLLALGKSLEWALIFNLNNTPLGETGCLSNPYFLLTDSQLGYLWLPTLHCAAFV